MKHTAILSKVLAAFVLAALLFATLPAMPVAAGAENLTASGTYTYPLGAPATNIGDVSITNDGAGTTNATVYISSGFLSGDVLSVGSFAGITPSYNAASGVLTLTGVANGAGWQTILRSVTFSTTAAAGPRTVTFSLGSALPYSGTGHYYEYVAADIF